jgi:glucan biosynthesis protein C
MSSTFDVDSRPDKQTCPRVSQPVLRSSQTRPLDAGEEMNTDLSRKSRASRVAFLDGARSVLMILGVFLHGANIYATNIPWIISDSQKHVVFDIITRSIHLFRMPAFFMVAGYFSAMLLTRRTIGSYIRQRGQRLGIPFLFTLLTINICQLLLIYGSPDSLVSAMGRAVGGAREFSLFVDRWISHLWFLIDAFILSVTGAAIHMGITAFGGSGVARRVIDRSRAAIEASSYVRLSIVVLALPFLHFLILVIMKISGITALPELGFFYPYRLAEMSQFFFVGMLCYHSPAFLRRISTVKPADAVALAILLVLFVGPWSGIELPRVASTYATDLAIWLSIICFMWVFASTVKKPSRLWRYLSDASYTVYLLHHIIVVLIGSLILDWSLSAYVKYLIVVGFAIFLPLLFHHFAVLRIPPLRFALNGKNTDHHS